MNKTSSQIYLLELDSKGERALSSTVSAASSPGNQRDPTEPAVKDGAFGLQKLLSGTASLDNQALRVV
uniref:Uncharacterized protein n=1 Tax=Oryza sativa subsp. japonica TaxID=39947 RepID=Q6Z1D3_ORYSJ|nr:hypothetical protein [Oryza sativa Japonica Group]